jgi:diguanylate cyclase (GGDEF)-like protein
MGVAALHDPGRLAVLHDLAILDTPPEAAFDDVARLASVCCNSPIAAVNFVDAGRHWTKAMIGAEGGAGASVSNDLSFCAATVASESGSLTVPDTLHSEAWRSHPFVTGPPYLRFYAGAAIVVSGQPVGVVCVFGDEPREAGDKERDALAALARQASANLDLRKHNAALLDFALRDPLTGLANRTLLFDRLEMAIAQRERNGGEVGVLFCDVDGFKLVNDRWGHTTGDLLLCRVGELLESATRETDTVARFAGDEFVVVCPELKSCGELDTVVERVASVVHMPRPGIPRTIGLRLSIGAALLADGETASAVLRRADRAMYQHKASALLSTRRPSAYFQPSTALGGVVAPPAPSRSL